MYFYNETISSFKEISPFFFLFCFVYLFSYKLLTNFIEFNTNTHTKMISGMQQLEGIVTIVRKAITVIQPNQLAIAKCASVSNSNQNICNRIYHSLRMKNIGAFPLQQFVIDFQCNKLRFVLYYYGSFFSIEFFFCFVSFEIWNFNKINTLAAALAAALLKQRWWCWWWQSVSISGCCN